MSQHVDLYFKAFRNILKKELKRIKRAHPYEYYPGDIPVDLARVRLIYRFILCHLNRDWFLQLMLGEKIKLPGANMKADVECREGNIIIHLMVKKCGQLSLPAQKPKIQKIQRELKALATIKEEKLEGDQKLEEAKVENISKRKGRVVYLGSYKDGSTYLAFESKRLKKGKIICELMRYQDERNSRAEKDKSEYYHWWGTLFGIGYSRKQKEEAVQDAIDKIRKGGPIDPKNLPPLLDGKLNAIIRKVEYRDIFRELICFNSDRSASSKHDKSSSIIPVKSRNRESQFHMRGRSFSSFLRKQESRGPSVMRGQSALNGLEV